MPNEVLRLSVRVEIGANRVGSKMSSAHTTIRNTCTGTILVCRFTVFRFDLAMSSVYDKIKEHDVLKMSL